MKTALRSLLTLMLAAAPFASHAQHPYVAASAGQPSWDFDCGAGGCDRHGSAWRVAGGMRFNRVVAVEAFVLDLGRARSSEPGIDGDWRGRATGVQVLVGWQPGGFDIAGKIGLASVRADFRAAPTSFEESEVRTHAEPIAGLMLAYRVTPQLAVRFDFDIVTVALNSRGIFYGRGADVSTFSLGLAWQF